MARGAARGPARRSAAPTPANRCAGIAAGHPRRLLGSPGRFGRLLPEHVVADHVHRAVSDLLGSINAEALPEMASRLVTVRLEQHLTDTEQPPNDQRDHHG